MPDTSLLRLSRSKAVRRALPRVVSPHACRFFSSLIKVAWFSFQPAYGANKHTHRKRFHKRCKALQEQERDSIRSCCSAVKTQTHAASHTVSDDMYYKTRSKPTQDSTGCLWIVSLFPPVRSSALLLQH